MRYLFLSVVLGLVVCGCGGSRDDAAGGDGEGGKLIGATLITQTHVFYQDMVAAMQEEAVKNNFRLSIRYAENDGAAQNNHIGTFITQGVDAIILAPCDSDAIAPAVEEATRAGIPVFTADIAAHNAPVVCHVASDNVQGGRLIGEYLAKLLDNQGKVAIVDYPEVASVQDRVAGFEEVMNAHEGLTVVQKISGQGQRDRAHKATQDLLQSRQDIDAIFGINDDSALGALAA
ncbi:MAG: substrate-binding domain-containing protein, partial [Candidatus Hydrogenedentes bacterium]|nr:substrate-binding domain-containing protein [Candidatus Hydrogenedentota bacterium]